MHFENKNLMSNIISSRNIDVKLELHV